MAGETLSHAVQGKRGNLQNLIATLQMYLAAEEPVKICSDLQSLNLTTS